MTSCTAASLDLGPVVTRPARPSDMNLVFKSWLDSYLHGSIELKREMRDRDYFDHQRKRIQRLLDTGSSVVVAVHRETPNVILAWACLGLGPSVFHYVYTVKEYRRQGHAKRLVAGRTVCTHVTSSTRPDSFASWKRRAGFRFLPHLLDGGVG